MTNLVHLPIQVALLLRRLASMLSASNQYLLLRNANARSSDPELEGPNESACEDVWRLSTTWGALRALLKVCGEKLDWTGVFRDGLLRGARGGRGAVDMSELPMSASVCRTWSLHSMWGSNRAIQPSSVGWWVEAWSWPSLPSKVTASAVIEPVASFPRPVTPPENASADDTTTWLGRLFSTALTSREPLPGASPHPDASTPPPEELPPPSPNDIQKPPPPPATSPDLPSLDAIHRLLQNPTLYNPTRAPRFPIVLCHGLYGFDVRGPSAFPSLRINYWSNVLDILRKKVGAEVIVTSVPGTGSIASRAHTLDQQLQDKAHGRGVNFVAHSMGGLDCRYLISHTQPSEYTPLSLLTIGTPHRGSPFMDWCAEHIGIGRLRTKEEHLARAQEEGSVGNESATATSAFTAPTPRATPSVAPPPSPTPPPQASNSSSNSTFPQSLASLPSSFTTLLLSMVDSPAYFNLTSPYLANHFNLLTPDHPRVKYFSVAGRMQSVSVWHPFWFPKLVLDGVEEREREKAKKKWEAMGNGDRRASESKSRERPLWERDEAWGNDGLVTVQSAKWGEFLGIMEGCDHWELRGARGIAGDLNVDLSIGEGWGLRDWGGLVRAFKRDERRPSPAPTTQGEKEQVDADIKSSTDRLSAVFDWIVEHVPHQAAPQAPKVVATKQQRDKERRNELASKGDLERFYVALSRKLYDEGL